MRRRACGFPRSRPVSPALETDVTAAPTIFLVDDDLPLRASLEHLLCGAGFDCQAFSSPEAFLIRHDSSLPGCLVLDLSRHSQHCLELYENMRAGCNSRSTVFTSGHGSIGDCVRAMKAGAIDFLVKPFADEVLLAAVQCALEEDQRKRLHLAQLSAIHARVASLTARERQVMNHVVRGRMNKQIAADLGTSEKTIKVHRARAMSKMGVQSLAELVRVSMEASLTMEDEALHALARAGQGRGREVLSAA